VSRNPIEMMYSLHVQLVYSGFENIVDFRETLQEVDDLGKLINRDLSSWQKQ